MPTITVRASGRTYRIREADAILVETLRSEHVPAADGALELRVVRREGRWTITTPQVVDGWLGGVRSWAGGGVREYSISVDLVDDVVVDP
jgi:hypothetical protein